MSIKPEEVETLNEYQLEAHHTAKYNLHKTIPTYRGDFLEYIPAYPFLKITAEASEILDKISKVVYRGDNGGHLQQNDLLKELGDVLWYVAEGATVIDAPLRYVAQENLRKLQDRMERNMIHGSGDNR